MRAFEFLLEDVRIPKAEQTEIFSKLQGFLSSKIAGMTYTADNLDNLKEIEEILTHTSSFSRRSNLQTNLSDIPGYMRRGKNAKKPEGILNKEAIGLLSKYIAGTPGTPEQKREFIDLLKSDQLIDQEKLLSLGEKRTLIDVIPSAATNPFIRELVDDLMRVSDYGVGKGEFFLSAFSPTIGKKAGAGDLEFSKFGNKEVEVKTIDKSGGRFYDRAVKPTGAYGTVCKKLKSNFAQELSAYKIPATGISLNIIFDISIKLKQQDPQRHTQYMENVSEIIHSLFPYASRRADHVVGTISNANPAHHPIDIYVLTAYTNYLNYKGFSGVMMIDIQKEPVFVYVEDPKFLNKFNMWLAPDGPPYVVASTSSDAYPQTKISYQSHADPSRAPVKQAIDQKFADKNSPPKPEGVPVKKSIATQNAEIADQA